MAKQIQKQINPDIKNDRLLPALFLTLLCLFVAFSNVYWLKLDNVPQAWDESIHLNAAAGFTKILKTNPVSVFASFITKETFYPPLVPLIGSFFGLFSLELDSITYSMTLFHWLLIISVFLLARRFYTAAASMAAAITAAAFPLIIHQGHYFMFDLPLAACTTMFIWLLLQSNGLTDRKFSFLAGAMFGAAMLIKWTFIIFALAPLIHVFMVPVKAVEKRATGHFITPALAICVPWYFWNLIPIATDLLFYSTKQGAVEGQPPVLSAASFFAYIKMIPDRVSWLLFVPFILSLYFVAKEKKSRFLLWYILVPLVVFTLLSNKKDRYIMPLLPLIAVCIGFVIGAIPSKLRSYAAVLLVAAAGISYFSFSYPVSYNWPGSARPRQAEWKIKEFLSAIEPGSATLCIVPDHFSMNNVSYSYYADNFYKDIKISGIYNFPAFCDYALVKTGDVGASFMALERRAMITSSLINKKGYGVLFEKIKESPMPDGSTAYLYKRKTGITNNSADIRQNSMSLVSKYLKSASDFNFDISDAGSGKKNVTLSFSKGFVGDFKHKDIGMNVKNVKIRVNGLLANPASVNAGGLELLSLDSLEIISVEAGAKELEEFVSHYAKGVTGLRVVFDNGLIMISGKYKNMPLEASFRLYNPSKEKSDIFFELKKLKVNGFPVPAGLVNFLIKDYNPLLNKANSPVKLKFNDISAENGVLKIY